MKMTLKASKLIVAASLLMLSPQGSTQGDNRPTPGAGGSSSTSSVPRLGDYIELDEAVKNEMYGTIDFPNAELKDIIKAISKLANKNFILDNKIQNRRITIVSPVPVTKQDAYNAFLSALYMNNLTIVSAGKFLKIIETKGAFSENTRIFYGDYAPASEEIVTVVYPLKHLSAEGEFSRFVADLVPRSGRVFVFPDTNSVVMTSTGLILRRAISILKALDVPGQQDQLESIPIVHASAKQIATLLDEILEAQSGTRSTRRSRRRSRSNEKKTRGGGTITKIVPDERTNSLVVLANGRGIIELKQLINKLDTPSIAGSGNIHIYYCKNSVAEELAQTLNNLIQAQRSDTRDSDSNAPRAPTRRTSRRNNSRNNQSSSAGVTLAGNVRVTADKATNSLVVLASSSDYAALKQVIEKLDIPRRQVYVEATIMEIRVRDNTQFGVGVNVAADGAAQIGGFRPSTMDQGQFQSLLTSPSGLSGLVAGVAAGRNVEVINPTTGDSLFSIKSVLGIIRAIEDSNQGQILHQPQILISDNEEAEIVVKDKIPVPKEDVIAVGDNSQPITKFENEEIKISLKITPQIGEENDLVKLKVEQAVDDFTGAAVGNGQIEITERVANTSVVVRDGDTVVIGGLQKRESQDVRSKFPLLGDLPILGWLFKGSNTTESRSQLVLFLKPKIITEYSDLLNLTGDRLDRRKRIGQSLYDPDDRHAEEIKTLIETNQEDKLKEQPRGWGFKKQSQSFSTSERIEGINPGVSGSGADDFDTGDFADELEQLEQGLDDTPMPQAEAIPPEESFSPPAAEDSAASEDM